MRIPFLALLCACGGSSDDTKPSDSGTATPTPTEVEQPDEDLNITNVELDGECDMAVDYGGVVAGLFETYSYVNGTVADGVVPSSVLEEITVDGDCRLLKQLNPFCDPVCGPEEVCDFGTCIPYPANQDLGTLTVTGLVEDVVLEPQGSSNQYFNTEIPHPGFEEGSLIEMRTDGGAFEPVILHGVGVTQIELASMEWEVAPGEDFLIEWTPPGGEVVRSEVHVAMNVDQHGLTPIQIICGFPDTGSATVPSSLIDALVDGGVTGFPSATVTRRTVDSTEVGDGCMDLSVTSHQTPAVTVDGYIPCSPTVPCPSGLTCDPVLFICL